MKKNHLILIALMIFISFAVLVSINKSQSAIDLAYDNETKISNLEIQIEEVESN